MLEKVPKEIPGFPPEAVLVGLLASLIWILIYREESRPHQALKLLIWLAPTLNRL